MTFVVPWLSLLVSTDANAAYDVTISTAATSGGTLSSCTFTPTANNAVLNNGELNTCLGLGNGLVKTGSAGSQPGNISVTASISWSTNTLTLQANGSIMIDSTVAATSAAGLILTTNYSGGSAGILQFNGGNVTFQNTMQSLTINGTSYTLEATIHSLALDILATPGGYFALASDYNASGDSYVHSPIGATLTGVVEGLGNKIKNLTIDDGTPGDQVALFANSSGTISDLTLHNESVKGIVDNSSRVGGLIALNQGTLFDDTVDSDGSVKLDCNTNGGNSCSTDFNNVYVGGLAGENEGTISNSSANAPVTNNTASVDVGGLVGYNYGTATIPTLIVGSSSSVLITGSPGGDNDGGLVGANNGATITGSNASGNINCFSNDLPGGLVGDNAGNGSPTVTYGVIMSSFATGAVGFTDVCEAGGGLVGTNEAGGVIGPTPGSHPVNAIVSYATGDVTSSGGAGGLVENNKGVITTAYETGNVTASAHAGGLADSNSGSSAAISQSFALGSVVNNGSDGLWVGGLLGIQDGNNDGGTIEYSYSLGDVSTETSNTGGSIGKNQYPTAGGVNVTQVYEAGKVAVSMSPSCIGAFAGTNGTSGGPSSVSLAIYNSSLNTIPGFGCGNGTNIAGSTMLQSGVPDGYSTDIWTYDPSGDLNCGYPYLIAVHPPTTGFTCPSMARREKPMHAKPSAKRN